MTKKSSRVFSKQQKAAAVPSANTTETLVKRKRRTTLKVENGATEEEMMNNEGSSEEPATKIQKTNHDGSMSEGDESEDESQCFAGKEFALHGSLTKSRQEIQSAIELHGGRYTTQITPNTSCVITNEQSLVDRRVLIDKAISANIPIIKEEFIWDCISQNKQLSFAEYTLVPPPASSQNGSTSDSSSSSSSLRPSNQINTVSLAAGEDFQTFSNQLAQLISTEEQAPALFDITFTVGEQNFHTAKIILCVRSAYFKQMVEGSSNLIDISTTQHGWISKYPNVFKHVLQYLVCCAVSISQQCNAVESITLASYASQIGLTRLKEIAEENFKNIIDKLTNEEKNIQKAIALMNSLKSLDAENTKEYSSTIEQTQETVKKFIIAEGNQLMEQNPEAFVTLPKSVIQDILAKEFSSLPEDKLFSKVLDWGRAQLKLREINEPTIEQLKEEIGDILPLIRFEHIPLETLVSVIEPSGLIDAEQMLAIIKATLSAKSGGSYSILGTLHTTPRKKRTSVPTASSRPSTSENTTPATPQKAQPATSGAPAAIITTNSASSTPIVAATTQQASTSVTSSTPTQARVLSETKIEPPSPTPNLTMSHSLQSPIIGLPVAVPKQIFKQQYTIKMQDVLHSNGKLALPDFELYGQRWFLSVHVVGKYLSLYVYNRQIMEGKILTPAMTTAIKFTLFHRTLPSKNKVSQFTKQWDKVKAWGYSNFLEAEQLIDEKNGWYDQEKKEFIVELTIEKTSS